MKFIFIAVLFSLNVYSSDVFENVAVSDTKPERFHSCITEMVETIMLKSNDFILVAGFLDIDVKNSKELKIVYMVENKISKKRRPIHFTLNSLEQSGWKLAVDGQQFFFHTKLMSKIAMLAEKDGQAISKINLVSCEPNF